MQFCRRAVDGPDFCDRQECPQQIRVEIKHE
jgi:hypothetical protein